MAADPYTNSVDLHYEIAENRLWPSTSTTAIVIITQP